MKTTMYRDPANPLAVRKEADDHWTDLSECAGSDPELFYPISEFGPARAQVAEAKRICFRCAVAAECLDWALRAGEPVGIWGGTTPEERRYLRR
ncbi:WhiB family transcriptional regulator [Actinocorallia sp. A-T 12471]|nr:WhiB family transcriptional regulator [Actinocorallia sp. A-T 12471]MDX6741914.1 WhiB family transcriptional regulator [Actinocorallia sp. A-T 12471]